MENFFQQDKMLLFGQSKSTLKNHARILTPVNLYFDMDIRFQVRNGFSLVYYLLTTIM
jgi:hypothetical protein